MRYRTVLSVAECQARLKAALLPRELLLSSEPHEPAVVANVLGRWFRLWTYVIPIHGSSVRFYGRLRADGSGTEILGHAGPALGLTLVRAVGAAMLLAIVAVAISGAWWAAAFPIVLLGVFWAAARAGASYKEERAQAYEAFLRERLLAAEIER